MRAAVANGASDARILIRHVLPNMLSTLIVQATVTIPAAIIGEAVLSFLGLGVQPPTPVLGRDARRRAVVPLAGAAARRLSRRRDLPLLARRSTCSATGCATSSTRGRRDEPARGRGPLGALRHRRRPGPRGRPAVVHARRRRGARRRRRVGLRQERQLHVAAAPAAGDGVRVRASLGSTASTCSPRRTHDCGRSAGARSRSSSRSR